MTRKEEGIWKSCKHLIGQEEKRDHEVSAHNHLSIHKFSLPAYASSGFIYCASILNPRSAGDRKTSRTSCQFIAGLTPTTDRHIWSHIYWLVINFTRSSYPWSMSGQEGKSLSNVEMCERTHRTYSNPGCLWGNSVNHWANNLIIFRILFQTKVLRYYLNKYFTAASTLWP